MASIPIKWGLDDSALSYQGIRFDWEWTRHNDLLTLRFDAPGKADFENFASKLRNDLGDLVEVGVLNPDQPGNHSQAAPNLLLGKYAKHFVRDQAGLEYTILGFTHSPTSPKSNSNSLRLFHPNGWDGIGHYAQGDKRMGALEIQVKGYTRLAAQMQSKAEVDGSWQALNNSLPIRLRVVSSKLLLVIGVLSLLFSAEGILFIMFGAVWPPSSLQLTLWIALIGIGGSYLLGMRVGREHRLTQINLEVFEERRWWLRSIFDLPIKLSNIRIRPEEIVQK
ncbi:MAG: hypothetical protein H6591_13605 [Flavobacteriales bacterium]|nr:hypothetical protein [Flavobacteriales bacterium]